MSQLSDIKKRAEDVLAYLERTYDFRKNYIPGMTAGLTSLARLVEDIKKLPENDDAKIAEMLEEAKARLYTESECNNDLWAELTEARRQRDAALAKLPDSHE